MNSFTNLTYRQILSMLCVALLLSACSGGGGGDDTGTNVTVEEGDAVDEVIVADSVLDTELRALIDENDLSGDPSVGRNLPSINDPKAQLGKQLFFAKNLGGVKDAACVSCHHPSLGGGDNLSLSVGVSAVNANGVANAELLGLGRFHDASGGVPAVPRNAPTVFNAGLWDGGLFWDSRVASDGAEAGANGQSSAIITPDSADFNAADALLAVGTSLPAAQARFPVTSGDEMRGTFDDGASNETLRSDLALRFTDVGTQWPQRFADVYGDNLINFQRIAESIGEYERSMVFIDNPWKQYIEGDNTALSDQQKRGAILFYTPANQGGADCMACHSGDKLSDERHHLIAFPQIGPGKGDTSVAGATDDFGREQVTGRTGDRYHFRTASLLNVALTAPYGHAGAYSTLEQVVRHYSNPEAAIDDYFGVQSGVPYSAATIPFCELPQIQRVIAEGSQDCNELYPDAYANSMAAINRLDNGPAAAPLRNTPNLNDTEVAELVRFMEALTDSCAQDRACINDWIVDEDDVAEFPDSLPLVAEDEFAVKL